MVDIRAQAQREQAVRELVCELPDLACPGSRDLVLMVGTHAMIRALMSMSERGEYHAMYWVTQGFLIGHEQALTASQKGYPDLFEKIKLLKEKLY